MVNYMYTLMQIGDWGFIVSGMCLGVFIKVLKNYSPQGL